MAIAAGLAVVAVVAVGPSDVASAVDPPQWLLPTLKSDSTNSMSGDPASRSNCIAPFGEFRDDGYFGYPVGSLTVLNATWDQPSSRRDADLANQTLGPGGYDVVVNGTFFKTNAAGRYIPVGPVVRNSRLDAHDYPVESQRRGGVAVLSDGSMVVGRADGLKIDDISRRFGSDGRTVDQFMGGGALLIENGNRVNSGNLADEQLFTNNGLGFNAEQFRRTSHVVIAVRDGQLYLVVSENKSGSELQNDLIANNFSSAVMFDGGQQTYLADNGQGGAGTKVRYGRDNYTGFGIKLRRDGSLSASAACGQASGFCVGKPDCVRSGPVSSNAESICRDYAQAAVAAHWENLTLGCGFGGGRWQSNYDAHYNWCMLGTNKDQANKETNSRDTNLTSCRRQKALCTRYATDAVAQNKRNLSLKCRFGGPAWQSNYDAHYSWCFGGIREAVLRRETNGRGDALTDCARRRVECTRYARTAVGQNERNLAMNCGFGGPAWQSDYDAHYNWCFGGVSLQRQKGENAARESNLKSCRERTGTKKSCSGKTYNPYGCI